MNETKICKKCEKSFNPGDYVFSEYCKPCYYEIKAEKKKAELAKRPFWYFLNRNLNETEMKELKKTIRSTNKDMRMFFSEPKLTDWFKEWLKKMEDIYGEYLEFIDGIDGFVEEAIERNTYYKTYQEVKSTDYFIRLKAMICDHFITMEMETKSFVIKD